MTHTKIKDLIDQLEQLQEDLMALPDDMLLNIDARDNESIDKGTQFIKSYNENLSGFSEYSARLVRQIKDYFEINPEMEDIESEQFYENKSSRIIKELDTTQAYSITDNFTYKRPYGFILGDIAFKGIKTWRSLFSEILKVLAEKNPEQFQKLPEAEEFISSQGNPFFSKDQEKLRMPEKTDMGFYVEVNHSANGLMKKLENVMNYLNINPENLQIYLREDRDAE